MVAAVYHFVFAASCIASCIGMWTGKPWGYSTFMTTAAICTIDKIQRMLIRDAFCDYILQQLTVTRDMAGWIPSGPLIQYFMIANAVLLLGWWGFALYIYMRRQYFGEGPSPITGSR